MNSLHLAVILTLICAAPALAQTDESTLPPTDYGAGYRIVMFHQHLEHPPGKGDDPGNQGPIKLDTVYPLIVSPMTRGTKAYNSKIKQLAELGTNLEENTTASDPDTDYSTDCEPVGLDPPVDGRVPSGLQMLPGVIAVACERYSYTHGYPHGFGNDWGVDWLVSQGRELRASDVFDTNSRWLHALTILADDVRGTGADGKQDPLNFSDTSHWVVTSSGLGLTYSWAEFYGFMDGGSGMIDIIPWSKLAPYLRKGGIVPQSDWSATLAAQN